MIMFRVRSSDEHQLETRIVTIKADIEEGGELLELLELLEPI